MAQHHLVIPDTMQGRVIMFQGTLTFTSILHWTIPAGTSVTPTLADAIFNALATLWTTNLAATANATQVFSKVGLRDLRTANQPEVLSTPVGHVGTGTGDAMPPSIAAVLSIKTALAGRKYRGRIYWPLFIETANGANGRMAAATKTALDAFATGFISAASQSGTALGVAHRPTLFDPDTGLPVAPGLGFTTPATQILVRDDRWDSQRRRNV